MTISLEALALLMLSAITAGGGWIMRRMVRSVDKMREDVGTLTKCMAVVKTWREEHDKRHHEVREERHEERREIWDAIDRLREERGRGKP